MATLSTTPKPGFFKTANGVLPFRWIVWGVMCLMIGWLGGQHFLVRPAERLMYEEALKAVGRGDDWCANRFQSWTAEQRLMLCKTIAENNSRIIDRTISAGRR